MNTTTETRTLTTKKGRSIETSLFDYDALETLRDQKGDFAQDLVEKEDKYGLSPDQWVWVHILAIETVPTAQEKAIAGYEVASIVNLLSNAAANGLKFPAIKLDGVKLSLCGSKAKVPGAVNVTDGGPYGANQWYGRIELDGKWTPRAGTPQAIIDVVLAFDASPAKGAAVYGTETGSCCFCRKELTTKESLSAGYGPICAGRYGLPWGEVETLVEVE